MAMFGFGGGYGDAGGGGGYPQRFEEQYHCYPVSFQDKEHLEGGDKILLPSSALDTLARLHVEYPMLFEISNAKEGKRTHCGVLEFSAPEGECYVPFWMMQNLLLEAGDLLSIKNVSLPKATFTKMQPQSVDFLEISNPRAVLEKQLRHFSCLTEGDHICVPYNDRKYYFEVKEVKPSPAACIIETDCNLDFDAPVGYKEPERQPGSMGSSGMALPKPASGKATPKHLPDDDSFKPFEGGGTRLDGKAVKVPQQADNAKDDARVAALAAAEKRASTAAAASNEEQPNVTSFRRNSAAASGKYAKRKSSTSAFIGSGNTLK
ncbi:unnamed protein product [Chrysoparadoxa australica]